MHAILLCPTHYCILTLLVHQRNDGRASNLMGRTSQLNSMIATAAAAAAADDSLQEGQQHTCRRMVESPIHEEGQDNIVNHQEGSQVRLELGHTQGSFRKRSVYSTAEFQNLMQQLERGR